MNDGTPEHEQLLAKIRDWIADDPDPSTRSELEARVDAGDWSDLTERFAGPLRFGTAGLRGLIGAGPGRMNEATVARATTGLARQLLADTPNAATRGVVVGRDARRMSPELARVTAEVLAGHGITVHWFDTPVPTPVAAFALGHLNAAAAVVVTASHNPPDYNGYKVYAARGPQIVPPQDERIRAFGEDAGPVREFPRLTFSDATAQGYVKALGPSVREAYLTALDGQCLGAVPPPSQPRIVTTALHGVGHRWVHDTLTRRGFTELHPVTAQMTPDGNFPTVAFPNPEEEGALDMAMALARDADADLILANDPDTDRLCVATRDEASPEGYSPLTGNELGILLADWLLTESARQHRLPNRPLVLTTVVSTSMLARVAETHGARCEEVLTGFKWIWDRALAMAPKGWGFVFGFEEALGYCVGPVVRDKDGVGAAAVLAEMAAEMMARGSSLRDHLNSLYQAHGLHLTRQLPLVLPGLDGRRMMDGILKRLRADPPDAIDQVPVQRQRDLAGEDADRAGLPRSDVLTWWLEDDSRVICRPSGTEPKLKWYFEVCVPIAATGHDALQDAQKTGEARLDRLVAWARQRCQ